LLIAEFAKMTFAIGIAFLGVGFIGFFVKLICMFVFLPLLT
jgi:preprotein translocase subunit Sss1